MIERDVVVTTKYGHMPSFAVCPEGPGTFPPVIFYMDAPGIREELRNMARRIARAGYFCLLPDMYYRMGTIRFDVQRRNDAMSAAIRAVRLHLTNAMVTDDTGGILAWLDAQDKAKPGPVGCVGHCMSGSYVTTVAARFPQRFAAVASLYGVQIVTDQPDSPHLLADRIKAELFYSFGEDDPLVPPNVIPTFKAALEKHRVKHTIEVPPGTKHGYQFPEREAYNAEESEKTWIKLFALWERNLK